MDGQKVLWRENWRERVTLLFLSVEEELCEVTGKVVLALEVQRAHLKGGSYVFTLDLSYWAGHIPGWYGL